MFAIVYRCRRQGVRLDLAAIQAESASGELRVQSRGFNNRMAALLRPDGENYALPVLDKVRLLAINDRGMLLSGLERLPPRGAKGSGESYMQTWWCVLKGPPAKTIGDPAEARAQAREIEARQIGKALNRWPARRGTFS